MTEVDIVASPYRAYRWLRIALLDGKTAFSPFNQPTVFTNGTSARCLSGRNHSAPDLGCTCGFYACETIAQLRESSRTMPVWKPETLVLAEVTMWGRVVEHEYGLRAQWQRVDNITLGPAPCGHQADVLVALRRDKAVERQAAVTRPGCSRCESGDIDLAQAANQLGVRFSHHPTPPRPKGPQIWGNGKEQIVASCAAASLLLWAISLSFAIISVTNTGRARLNADQTVAALTSSNAGLWWLGGLATALACGIAAVKLFTAASAATIKLLIAAAAMLTAASAATINGGEAARVITASDIATAIEQTGLEVRNVNSAEGIITASGRGEQCLISYSAERREAQLTWECVTDDTRDAPSGP